MGTERQKEEKALQIHCKNPFSGEQIRTVSDAKVKLASIWLSSAERRKSISFCDVLK